MNRSARILLAVLALLLVAVASAIAAPAERGRERMAPVAASHQPEPEDDAAPTAEQLDRLVGRLAEVGIATDADAIAALAADHGVGGAIRLLAWADASGMTTDQLAGMFADGMGWGQIAKEHDLHPGIGWIMGNGGGGPPDHARGKGRAGAPGQQDR
jgi:hypothetical protein